MKRLYAPLAVPLRLFVTVASLALLMLVGSGCGLTIPQYTTIDSAKPPNYYLGESPKVSVVNAEGATRRLQDIAIRELRTQSRSNGSFVVENQLDKGIRFDVRNGQRVMNGGDASVGANDVLVKFRVIASMKKDGRTVLTRKTGVLGTETKKVPAMVTVMPVAFTVTKGKDVMLNERQYNGKAVWPINKNGGGYPTSYQKRYEEAVAQAVKEFLKSVTPRTVKREVRLDYSDKKQQPILNAARNGQVKEAATQLQNYVQKNPNSASAAYNLAVLTDALGSYEKAITYYDKALSLGGKDYYTKYKSQCMKRLNEKREMEGGTSTSSTSSSPAPASQTRTAGQRATPRNEVSQPAEERPGDGGNDVAWVQRTLKELGYDCGAEDGVMGPSTRSCIRSFQEANGLETTGKVSEGTYQQMLDRQ